MTDQSLWSRRLLKTGLEGNYIMIIGAPNIILGDIGWSYIGLTYKQKPLCL